MIQPKRVPAWLDETRNPGMVDDARLAELEKEAVAIDEHNKTGMAQVFAKLEEYKTAYREFFGSAPEVYKRRGTGKSYIYVALPGFGGMYDGWAAGRLQSLKNLVTSARQKKEQERLAAEQEARKKEAQRLLDKDLTDMRQRYSLPEEADWEDILDHLCAKNQYLDLAIAGLLTRSDWSDGFYRVEGALKRFKINSEQDKDIAADLLGCCRGDHEDGRIFRDTDWNYNALFELINDPLLVEDAKQCARRIRC